MLRRSSILTLAFLLAGCGHGFSPLPGSNLASSLDAQGRKILGGDAYAKFDIAPQLPKADGSRAATKLVYLMTDEAHHQSMWSDKMMTAMSAWKPKAVHDLIFRDGMQVGDSRMFYVSGQGQPASSLLAPGVQEVQSNNPKVFSEVLGYTFSAYPGKKRYVELYTHGGGVFGIGCDENQTDLKGQALPKDKQIGIMRLQDFGESIRQGLKGRKLDLFYFRACLMGNLEALTEIADTTRFAIASEEVSGSVENSNITMTQQFEDLAEQDADAGEIARQMAITAHAKHPQGKDGNGDYGGYMTFAAFDLSRVDDLNHAVSALAHTLIAEMPTHGKEILAAYDGTPTYNGKQKPEEYYEEQRDLWAFTASLLHGVNDKAVQDAASRVRDAQTAFTIHEKDAYASASNGLSIYMPARSGSDVDKYAAGFLANGYTKTKFAQKGEWLHFLQTVLAAK